MLKTFLFVGNSIGVIRAFDMKKQIEMKPLFENQLAHEGKVTVMEIDEETGLMMSGYKGGGLALWDLLEYKLLKYIPRVHSSEVTNIKFYSISATSSQIFLVSCEDLGAVLKTEIHRRAIFGGYTCTHEQLFSSNKMKSSTAIAVYQPNLMFPHNFCDATQPIAFGCTNLVSICTMKPIDGLHMIQRPIFCKDKC